MTLQERNNVHAEGGEPAILVHLQASSCDQALWQLMAP
jgi:hypothetical protein